MEAAIRQQQSHLGGGAGMLRHLAVSEAVETETTAGRELMAAAAATGRAAAAEEAELAPLFTQHAQRARWAAAAATEGAPSDTITWTGAEEHSGGGGRGRGHVSDRCEAGGPHAAPPPTPAQLSQLYLTADDDTPVTALAGGNGSGGEIMPALPAGRLDVNGQQIDLRTTNSWRLKMGDVSTPELAEVFAINTLAPFVLNARLQPLLAATAAQRGAPPVPQGDDRMGGATPGTGGVGGAAFIVNVSAMEGKFYRHKTANHPHTNMAKAALNMMTRTSAAELASSHRIYMTAVDTGWINDENPRERAARTAAEHHFQTPLDEVDAAARVLHPVFAGVLGAGTPLFGVFLKDYAETEW